MFKLLEEVSGSSFRHLFLARFFLFK